MTNQLGEVKEIIQESESKNNVASALEAIAWITFIGGFIAGFFIGPEVGAYSLDGGFSFLLAIPYWVGSFITGTMFLGFAEIIKLLQKLVDRGKIYSINISREGINENLEQYYDLPGL